MATQYGSDLKVNVTNQINWVSNGEGAINSIIDALTNLTRGRNYQQYWKTQEKLIEETVSALNKYNEANRNGETISEEMAASLVKTANALKSVSDGADISTLRKEFNGIDDVLSDALSRSGKLAEAFSVKNFDGAFALFNSLKEGGVDMKNFFRILEGADVSAFDKLKSELADALNELKYSEREVDRLKEELGDLRSTGIDDLKDQLDELRMKAEDTFKTFLKANNLKIPREDYIEDYDYKYFVDSLIDGIQNGTNTAEEAITEFKDRYGYLLKEINSAGESSGGFINQEGIDENLQKLDQILLKIEEIAAAIQSLSSGYTPNFTLGGQGSANINFEAFEQIIQIIKEFVAESGEVKEANSTLELLFKTINDLSSASEEKVANIKSLFFNLNKINELKVSKAASENLAALFNSIDSLKNAQNIAFISGINLDGFKDLKISKASLANLAEYLPQISSADMGKLTELSNIDFTKLNSLKIDKASVAALASLEKINPELLKNSENVASSTEEAAKGLNSEKKAAEEAASAKEKAANAEKELAENSEVVKESTEEAAKGINKEKDAANLLKTSYTTNSSGSNPWSESYDLGDHVTEVLRGKTDPATGDGSISKTIITDYVARRRDAEKEITRAAKEEAAERKRITDEEAAHREKREKEFQNYLKQAESQSKTADIELAKSANPFLSQKQSAAQTSKAQYAQNELDKTKELLKAYSDVENYSERIAKSEKSRAEYSKIILDIYQAGFDTKESDKSLSGLLSKAKRESDEITKLVAEKSNKTVGDKELEEINKQIAARREAHKITLEQINALGKIISGDKEDLQYVEKIKKAREQRKESSVKTLNTQSRSNAKNEDKQSKDEADWAEKRVAEIDKVKAKISELNEAVKNAGSLGIIEEKGKGVNKAIEEYENLKKQLDEGSISSKEYSVQMDRITASANLSKDALEKAVKEVKSKKEADEKAAAVTRDLDSAIRNNSGAQRSFSSEAKEAYQKLLDLQEALVKLNEEFRQDNDFEKYKRGLEDIDKQIKQNEKTIKDHGSAFKSFKDSFADLPQQLISRYITAFQAIRAGKKFLEDAIKTTIQLQDALAELQIVTNGTGQDFELYAKNVAKEAQSISVSTSDLISATTTYARLGYSISESDTLAKYTAMLQKVGSIDSQSAQDAVTAMIAAFPEDVTIDNIEEIMNELVIVGNNFPISVSQIATGMNEASSALAAAGNSFEESVALLTAGNVTMQNANKTATALRTISARIRNTATDLEELGETDFTSAKYDELVQAVTKYKVSLTDVNGEYRSTYDIMSDIAGQWKNLSSMEQAALATAVAGTRQQSVFYSMMQNWDTAAVKSIEKMGQSDNALTDAYSIYEDTISAALQRMHTAFDELQIDAMETFVPVIDFAIQTGTAFLNIADAIVNVANEIPYLSGLLTTVLGGSALKAFIAGGPLIKLLVAIPLLVTGIVSSVEGIKTALDKGRSEADKAAKEYENYVTESEEKKQKLEEYIGQIEQLRAKIADTSISDAELYAAQGELLKIKQDMIDMFGEEAAAINILKGDVDEVTQSYRDMFEAQTKGEATKFLNENRPDAEKSAKKLLEQKSGKQVLESIGVTSGTLDKVLGAFSNEKYGAFSLEKYGDLNTKLSFSGTSREIIDQVELLKGEIDKIMSESVLSDTDSAYLKSLKDYLDDIINSNPLFGDSIKAIEEKNGTIFDQTIVAEINANDQLRESYEKVAEAQAAYVEAENAEYESDEEKTAKLNELANAWREANEALRNVDTTPVGGVESGDVYEPIVGEFLRSAADDSDAALAEKERQRALFESVKLTGQLLEADKEDAAAVADKAEATEAQANAIKDYNEAAKNSNLDYANRPHISAQKLIDAGWADINETRKNGFNSNEINPDDIATIFTQGTTIGDENIGMFTIEITPILEDGTVLTPESLQEYINSLDTGNGIAGLFASDIDHLIANAVPGTYEDNKEYLEEYYKITEEAKEKELEAYLESQESKNNVAEPIEVEQPIDVVYTLGDLPNGKPWTPENGNEYLSGLLSTDGMQTEFEEWFTNLEAPDMESTLASLSEYTSNNSALRDYLSNLAKKYSLPIPVSIDASNVDVAQSFYNDVQDILAKYIDKESGKFKLNGLLLGSQYIDDIIDKESKNPYQELYDSLYNVEYYEHDGTRLAGQLDDDERAYLELAVAAEKYGFAADGVFAELILQGKAFSDIDLKKPVEDADKSFEELETKSKGVLSGLSNIKSAFDSMSNDTPISIDDFESLTKLSDDFSAVLSNPEIDKNKIIDAYGDAIDGVIEEYEEVYKANEESLAGEGSEEEKKKWQEENDLISIYISLLKQAKKESQGVIASSFDAEMSKVASAQSSIESIITSLQNEEVIDPSNFDVLKELSPVFSEIIANIEDGYAGASQLVEAYIKEVDESIIESEKIIEENEAKIEELTNSGVDGWEEQVSALNETNTKLLLQKKYLLDLENTTTGYLKAFIDNIYNKSKSAYSSIFDALNSQQYGGTIGVEEYDNLIDVMPEVSSLISDENGLIELNYENTMKLYDAKNALAIAEIEAAKAAEKENYNRIAREIRSLTKDQEDEIEAKKKELQASKESIDKYRLMRNELIELSSAYQKWKDAQNAGSSGDMRDDMQKAVDQINEALKSGQTGVGNYKYQAALDLVVPEEFQKDAASVQKYITALSRYITENPGQGASNFWSDIISAGLAEETKPGSGIYHLVEGANIYDIGKALGNNIANGMTLTPDMVKAMFGALEMYEGFEFHWSDFDQNLAEAQYLRDVLQEQFPDIDIGFGVDDASLDENTKKIYELYQQLSGYIEEVKNVSIGDLGTEEKQAELDNLGAKIENVKSEIASTAKESGLNNISIGLNSAEEESTKSKLEDLAADLDTIAEKADALLSKNIGTLGANTATAAIRGVIQAIHDLNNTIVNPKDIQINYKTSFTSVAPNTSGVNTGGWQPGRWQGTAAANGIGEPKGGKTLVGELGQEIWVSGDKFKTVGDNGAELINMKPGDIIFNAEDTKRILHGQSGARGISMMNGSAMVSGSGPKIVVYNGTGSGAGSGSGSNSTVENDEDNWFEWAYNQHKHLVAMDKEETKEFLDWLKDAWPKAYSEGIIEYTDALSYEEEVYNGLHELFQDYLSDEEFKIDKLKEEDAGVQELIDSYNRLSRETMTEIVKAKASGLDENDDYVQALYNSYYSYVNTVKDLQDGASDNAKKNMDSLIKYRMKMIKQDKKNQKDALNEQLSDLKEFVSKQKELLQDTKDEEKYLENQAELRKTVSDLEIQLNQLQYDNSAWATKRKLELQEELDAAKKALNDFEKDYAFDKTIELLDDSYEATEKIVKDQTEAIDDWLENEENVYMQALIDVQNNNQQLFDEMRAFERYYGEGEDSPVVEMWEEAYKALKNYINLYGVAYKGIDLINATGYAGPITGYATGTSNATSGLHKLFENGDEYIFSSSDGNKYRMFSGGEKVLNASQTSFLYDFAKSGSTAFANMFEKLSSVNIPNIIKNAASTINMGDIIIQGNADKSTVSEIRRQQRDSMNYMLKKLAVLQ